MFALEDHPFTVEFSFDAVDELYNGFRGWMIDRVRLDPDPDAPPPSLVPRERGPRR